tara:strand:+ start:36 stop:707 length:672 start_codon:yes stop_codon:yes gene_type:complete
MKNDFLNGIIVGIVQTLTGHPLDTLKVLQQTNVKKVNYKTIGLRNVYRGMLYPMLGSGIFNSIQFGSYQYIKQHTHNNVIAGLSAGFLSGIILCPIDVLKINKQIKNTNKVNIFKALHVSCVRESFSTYIYFESYYRSMQYLGENNKNTEINAFLSGGIAGVLSWFFIFPIDVVKTRLQSYQCDSIVSAIKYGSVWNGLTLCLIRGFIVNGSGFVAYNKLTNE